jgi:hypothetical protein
MLSIAIELGRNARPKWEVNGRKRSLRAERGGESARKYCEYYGVGGFEPEFESATGAPPGGIPAPNP